MLRQLARGIKRQDWLAIGLELIVVMVGLVAAFQVDRWWEHRGERRSEATYITRLIADLEQDIPDLEYATGLAGTRQDFADLLAEVATDPELALEEPVVFLAAVDQAAFTYTPALAAHTFDDLRATGSLSLIRDEGVRQALHEYYGYDEGQRQFIDLNLMIEVRWFELSTDILTHEQYTFVQDRWFVVNEEKLPEVREATFDLDEVRAAAERLRDDAELLDWLAQVRHVQVDHIGAHERRLEHARALLETLRAYDAELGD
jgi:hypothetical protein